MIKECSASSNGVRKATASALEGVRTNGAIAKSTSCQRQNSRDFSYSVSLIRLIAIIVCKVRILNKDNFHVFSKLLI